MALDQQLDERRGASFSQLRERVGQLVSHRYFETFIVVVIVLNAISLGLETSDSIMSQFGSAIVAFDHLALAIFVVEIGLKIFARGVRYFRDPWSWFDIIIVGFALLPQSGNLSVLRALRIIRAFRLISVVPSIRRVVDSLLMAIPSMTSISVLLVLINYVFAVMATKLYGDSFPQLFGTIGASLFTLFQVMTLEGWAMEIVRPVMEVYPNAWLFFMPYIFIVVFAVLNLFIGIIVDAMQNQAEHTADEVISVTKSEYQHLLSEIGALRGEIRSLARGPEGDGR